MNEPCILAASHLGPNGYGNDLTGPRPWPADAGAALRRGELDALRWSMLFASDEQRFARMDLMCRLGMMAAELLDAPLDGLPAARRDRIGVVVETRAGCLATDLQFLKTPRPSVFTYTLPSTVVGEVCIRYRLRGPVLCLIIGRERGGAAVREAADWLQADDADAVLCLGIEAIDPVSAGLLATLDRGASTAWQASALLIGRAEGGRREYALESGPVARLGAAIAASRAGRPSSRALPVNRPPHPALSPSDGGRVSGGRDRVDQ